MVDVRSVMKLAKLAKKKQAHLVSLAPGDKRMDAVRLKRRKKAMAASKRCADCDGYEKKGHNYCRICRFHLRAGLVQNARVAESYRTNERFCGYCGKTRDTCGH